MELRRCRGSGPHPHCPCSQRARRGRGLLHLRHWAPSRCPPHYPHCPATAAAHLTLPPRRSRSEHPPQWRDRTHRRPWACSYGRSPSAHVPPFYCRVRVFLHTGPLLHGTLVAFDSFMNLVVFLPSLWLYRSPSPRSLLAPRAVTTQIFSHQLGGRQRIFLPHHSYH